MTIGNINRSDHMEFALQDLIHPPLPGNFRRTDSVSHFRATVTALFLLLSSVAVVSMPQALAQEMEYYQITTPCKLVFPKDHGAHPGYQTEWWYYTGNLRSQKGDRYGFQLTFFRRQISPPDADRAWPEQASAWRTQQIFLAHAALTDIGEKHFHHGEEISREMDGLAGAHQEDGVTSVFIKDWSMNTDGEEHRIKADTEAFGFNLRLRSEKPPTLHGEAGYSRKGIGPERASCYYSFTRLHAEGSVVLSGTPHQVEGTAWMDHEFSSAPLEANVQGWDWFSLQFSNNTELMIYLLRKKDGTYSEASSGTFVNASGQAVHIDHRGIGIEVLDHWKSPRTGTVYPSSWQLRIQPLQIVLQIRPALLDQELQTPESTRITYWEGSVLATGSSAGQSISGEGYVEMTGYAGAMDERM